MIAHAAETAGAAGGSFFATPEFWVLVSFLIFLAVALKPIVSRVVQALDQRASTIRNQIDEATRLRDDAQKLLASYQRKQRDAAREAQEIVAQARASAEALTRQAEESLKRTLARREELGRERLRQAEAAATAEVRTAATEVALEAARRVLAGEIRGAKADALVDAAIRDLPARLR